MSRVDFTKKRISAVFAFCLKSHVIEIEIVHARLLPFVSCSSPGPSYPDAMSGPFYTRYIPPTFTPPKPKNATPEPALTSVTQNNASSTYARYIPRISKPAPLVKPGVVDGTAEHDSIDEPPAKRAKKEGMEKRAKKAKAREVLSKDESEMKEKDKAFLARREKSLKRAKRLKASQPVEEPEEVEEEPAILYPLDPLPQPDPVPEPAPLSLNTALPSWITEPIRVSSTATSDFVELGLDGKVAEHLHSKDFKKAFAVQAAVLPLLLPPSVERYHDVLVSAASGSGKTLAYVLPVVKDLSNTLIPKLRCVIVMPTRELVNQARQVCEITANAFASSSKRRVNIGVALGNHTIQAERESIMKGEQIYDPKEYARLLSKLNAKWETASCESDEDEEKKEEFQLLDDDVDLSNNLPGHVINYSPKIDILICTPGRLVEHLKTTKGFSLTSIKWLVIDEADKLLDQSFQQWREVVIGSLPNNSKDITKVLLSATMTRDLGKLPELRNDMRLRRPRLVIVDGYGYDRQNELEEGILSIPETLQEHSVKVSVNDEKPLYLLRLLTGPLANSISTLSMASSNVSDSESDLESDNKSSTTSNSDSDSDSSDSDNTSTATPSRRNKATSSKGRTFTVSDRSPRGVMIFTKSNENAVRLSRLIALMQPSLAGKVAALTSTVSKSLRKKTLRNFSGGSITVIVASDLVARGLDLPNLAHVVNYDIPTSLTSYVHRVGRTARGGKDGQAWTLNNETEAGWFWGQIGRSKLVQRGTDRAVKRYNIDAKSFSEDDTEAYNRALAELGREAHSK